MMPSQKKLGSSSAIRTLIVLVCLSAGCSEFTQRHLGSFPKDPGDGPANAAPALAIANPPAMARTVPGEGVKPAAFTQAGEPVLPEAKAAPLRILYERAARRHAAMDSYIFRLKRREVVAGKKQPEEVLLVKLRREPFSVYLKFLSEKGKGREVIYVRGQYDNKMQVLLAPSDDFSFMMKRVSIAPNDPMARAKCRYPITETGFGGLIDRYGQMVAAIEKGDLRGGTAKYLGLLKRPEFAQQLEAVQQTVPPGSDAQMPKGGQRLWFFDADSGLPALVIAHDPDGEVEYYCHDNVQCPVKLDDDDFNPERLWRK